MAKIKILICGLSAALSVGFIVSKTASAETSETTESPVVAARSQTKCRVKAYGAGFASDEPKTSIVRAKPAKNAAVLKTVTTNEEIVFYISGSDGRGWFEISKIETAGGDVDETMFEGRGWVHSSLLDLSVAGSDARLYAAPQKGSRVLKKLVVDASEARPVGCRGGWMNVKSGKLTGWLSPEGQCANPLTTCS